MRVRTSPAAATFFATLAKKEGKKRLPDPPSG
jgi:hypothetical protein